MVTVLEDDGKRAQVYAWLLRWVWEDEEVTRCEGSSKKSLKAISFFFRSLSRLFLKMIDHVTSVLVCVGQWKGWWQWPLCRFFPPFRYFLLHSLTQFEIVKQKEMKSLFSLTKPFKIILERPVIMIPLKWLRWTLTACGVIFHLCLSPNGGDGMARLGLGPHCSL